MLKIFCTPNFFGPKFFYLNFLDENFFWPKILLEQTLFGLKFFGHGFFWDQNPFLPNFILTKTTTTRTTTTTTTITLMGFDTIKINLVQWQTTIANRSIYVKHFVSQSVCYVLFVPKHFSHTNDYTSREETNILTSKKIEGPENFFGQKKFWVEEKFWVSKKIWVPNNFGFEKKFWVWKRIWV